MKYIILSTLLMGNCLQGMIAPHAHPATEARRKRITEGLDLLKNELFDKASPESIQKTIDEINKAFNETRQFSEEMKEVWLKIILPKKALLVGNAESAARVVDLQVQRLVNRNNPIPAKLQEDHANARTNVHLVKDWIYGLETAMRPWLR